MFSVTTKCTYQHMKICFGQMSLSPTFGMQIFSPKTKRNFPPIDCVFTYPFVLIISYYLFNIYTHIHPFG